MIDRALINFIRFNACTKSSGTIYNLWYNLSLLEIIIKSVTLIVISAKFYKELCELWFKS